MSLVILYPGGTVDPYHLLCNHYHRFGGEPSIAMVEKIFERGSKEIDDEDVMKAFLSKIIDIRNASCYLLVGGSAFPCGSSHTASDEYLVGSVLISKLGCVAFSRFLLLLSIHFSKTVEGYANKFDRNLLIVEQICPFEDYTKRPLSNFLADPVMHTYDI